MATVLPKCDVCGLSPAEHRVGDNEVSRWFCERHAPTSMVGEMEQILRAKIAGIPDKQARRYMENIKYRNKIKGKPCVRCGELQGVVPAHYSGLFSDQLGKGMGVKGSDFAIAALCTNCHEWMDNYKDGNDPERAAQFLVYCFKTLDLLLESGDIRIIPT